HDAGILADGTLAFSAHARVRQDLGNRILGCRALFALIGACQVLDVISRMVVADELHGIRDGLNEVVFFDEGGHDAIAGNKVKGYLPVQTGLRFSAKAVAPSLASAEVKIWAIRGRCMSNMSAGRQLRDSAITVLAACTASGPLAAISPASSRAASSAWPGSTSRLTRPK